jgi:hypothetical protein
VAGIEGVSDDICEVDQPDHLRAAMQKQRKAALVWSVNSMDEARSHVAQRKIALISSRLPARVRIAVLNQIAMDFFGAMAAKGRIGSRRVCSAMLAVIKCLAEVWFLRYLGTISSSIQVSHIADRRGGL